MSGDANAGGGGSVYWSVDVNNGVDANISSTKDSSGHHHQRGKDKDGTPGVDYFTVTIRIPQGQTPAGYLSYLQSNTNVTLDNAHVAFPVLIEDLGPGDDHKQISVTWGDQSGLPVQSHGSHGAVMAARGGARKHKGKKSSKPAKKVKTKPGKKR